MTSTMRAPKPRAPKATAPKPSETASTHVGAELEARLAVIEEVSKALEKQLDLDAIAELVGKRLHKSFPAADLFVALFDASTNTISFPYEIASGKRQHTAPISAESGLTGRVIKSGKPLLTRSEEEANRLGAISFGSQTRSWLGVPIIAAGDVIGVLAMESGEAGAFDEGDQQLLTAVASTTGVALRNAQLFAETTQRNAELAIINEIGEALARQQDFASITEAVGERIRTIFRVSTVMIAELDDANQVFIPLYGVDQGQRLDVPLGPVRGLSGEIVRTRKPLRLGTLEQAKE